MTCSRTRRAGLTAHVNFSAIQKAGEPPVCARKPFATQPQFLTRILARAVPEKFFARMDAKQIRQFQNLRIQSISGAPSACSCNPDKKVFAEVPGRNHMENLPKRYGRGAIFPL